jgi:hypothetical protein
MPFLSASISGSSDSDNSEANMVSNSCFAPMYFIRRISGSSSYFKELVGKEVTLELKNDLAIHGTWYDHVYPATCLLK